MDIDCKYGLQMELGYIIINYGTIFIVFFLRGNKNLKSKYKFALMFFVSAFFMLLGCVNVSAATLVEGPIDDVYYTCRGGGKLYMSA